MAFVFVVNVEEDNAVIVDFGAVAAVFGKAFVGFDAFFAVVVDEAVFAPAHVFLEAAVVNTDHFAVGLGRVFQDSADNPTDASVARRVSAFDSFEPIKKMIGAEEGVFCCFGRGCGHCCPCSGISTTGSVKDEFNQHESADQ